MSDNTPAKSATRSLGLRRCQNAACSHTCGGAKVLQRRVHNRQEVCKVRGQDYQRGLLDAYPHNLSGFHAFQDVAWEKMSIGTGQSISTSVLWRFRCQ